ncbi:hypothetical protein B0H21DRAFT_710791 [Amylocystis lapponica]|nr:hypothetical protein B0H21DRAFT_710791 [Amylocystis lapponica]
MYLYEDGQLLHDPIHTGMRIIMDFVESPLNTFRTMKESASVFCEATRGHAQTDKVGIRHRNVSEGSITAVDGKSPKGFIRDFDYSCFYCRGMEKLETSGLAELPPPIKKTVLRRTLSDVGERIAFQEARRIRKARAADVRALERTVLIWTVLQDTRCKHWNAVDAFRRLFRVDDGDEHRWQVEKQFWPAQGELDMPYKDPLTDLVVPLTTLMTRTHLASGAAPLDYKSVLRIFELLLQDDGGPTNDGGSTDDDSEATL